MNRTYYRKLGHNILFNINYYKILTEPIYILYINNSYIYLQFIKV